MADVATTRGFGFEELMNCPVLASS